MNKDFQLTEANVYKNIIDGYNKPIEPPAENQQTSTTSDIEVKQPIAEDPKNNIEEKKEEPKEEKISKETVVLNTTTDTTIKPEPTGPMYKLLRGKKHPLYQTTNSTYGNKKPTQLNKHLKWYGHNGNFTRVRIFLFCN
jgi:hypothetical protein